MKSKSNELERALDCAVQAAHEAGALMRRHFSTRKTVTEQHQHDIKLELDLRCQKTIERVLHAAFPDVSVLGEEGMAGDPRTERRWVVDPIDGTVNFAYGIPHSCVSIALQSRAAQRPRRGSVTSGGEYETCLGVIFDPFCDELWTGICGQPARLNGRIIRVSRRAKLQETVLSIGFAKYAHTMEQMLPALNDLIRKVRKVRIMGSAALSLAYVASGRFDAYLEAGIRLWDIAAGGLILECAGGEFWRRPMPGEHTFRIIANNGRLRRKLQDSIP